jgi:hypothetical protein
MHEIAMQIHLLMSLLVKLESQTRRFALDALCNELI